MRVARGQLWSVTLVGDVGSDAGERAERHQAVSGGVCGSVQRPAHPAGDHRAVDQPGTALPHHVPVIDDGGLDRPSWAMCEALRAVSVRRFGRLIGTVDKETLNTVRTQLQLWLDP